VALADNVALSSEIERGVARACRRTAGAGLEEFLPIDRIAVDTLPRVQMRAVRTVPVDDLTYRNALC
jgi:hypothetical protein